MPCDQVDRRWVPFAAALAAQALEQGFERDVTLPLYQQAHGEAC
jgi:hypothetical protein